MLKWNEISSSAKERNKKSSSDIYVGKLIDVKERSRAERKPLAYVHSRHVTSCKTNRFNTCTRAPKTLSHRPVCVPRGNAGATHDVPSPAVTEKIDKSSPSPACFSYVSIHTTCQPIVNHYCTFFRVYDIFYTLLF